MHLAAPPALRGPLHPLHAFLLSFPAPLFLGTLAADLAYARSAEIQWSNFAQWLNAAGVFFAALALPAALIAALARRGTPEGRGVALHGLLLFAGWLAGLFNAFIHARDAWGIMPDALWWSAGSALLVLIASWQAWRGFAPRHRWTGSTARRRG